LSNNLNILNQDTSSNSDLLRDTIARLESEIHEKKKLEVELRQANVQLMIKNEEIERLETQLKESLNLHKSVVDNSLDGTIIIDRSFKVLYANEEVVKITGFTIDELQNSDFRNMVESSSKSEIVNKFNELFQAGGQDIRFEFNITNKSGNKRNVYVSSTIMDDFQGHRANVCQILDITEIKKAEERQRKLNIELEKRVIERTSQLEDAMSELQLEVAVRKKTEEELKIAKEEVTKALEQEKELNSLKTRFISMISHEYRTPLTVILTSTYLIEQFYQGSSKEQFDKFLDKIRGSVKTMTQLLEDVLTIGKSESTRNTLNLIEMNIVDFTKDIIDEVKVIDSNKHEFMFLFDRPKLIIETDEKQLRHILSNLISNAAKYSPSADKVTVNISETDRHVQIDIVDKGIGIPKEDQSSLFESFYRARNVGSISGTGLGLAIVKKCVDLLNGSISVVSAEGEGTTFTIEIPKKQISLN